MNNQVPQSTMYVDISENGTDSKYWDDVAQYTLWSNKSAESQMYVAGLVYGFHHDELLRLISRKSQELLGDFDDRNFFYWMDFFSERRARRPEIIPKTERDKDLLKNGKFSEYWDRATRDLPWNGNSTEAKMYVVAKIYGYSHSETLNLIEKHAVGRGELGFFYWRDFLEEIREKEAEPEEPDEEIDVLHIPYNRFKLVATYGYKQNGQFAGLFTSEGELDEEFLKEIHFNATHSMSGSTVKKKSTMDGFIRGVLTGCVAAGIEEVKSANESIRIGYAR